MWKVFTRSTCASDLKKKKKNQDFLKESLEFSTLTSKASLKKAKRKFWNTQFVLSTLSKINQKQNKIDISISI
jgi:hypothetical protein